PDEYSINLKRGLLTRNILGKPFSILLLDEFEKSHPTIHDRFLQLVDEGCFINGAGETISCRSMIIIATSNAGAEIYRKNIPGFMKNMNFTQIDKEIDQALYREFRFEFLNRFDQIVHFHPLKREHIRIIALRELESLKKRTGIKQRGFVIDFDESIIDWLAINGFDPDYGARFLRRIMEKNVSTALADYIIRFTPGKGAHILLTVRNNKIIARNARQKPRIEHKVKLSIKSLYKKETMQINEGNMSKIISSLLSRAESKLQRLEQRKEEASELLLIMNEDGFWEDKEKKREVLENYKLLDVTIRAEKRLAKPIIELADAFASGEATDLTTYNKLIEKAATALYWWEERLAENKGGSVWMVLASSDPHNPDSDWLIELTNFEKKWCKRLNLYATIVAYSEHDNLVTRVIYEVNGPGAYTYLSMEQGLHRKLNQNAKNERALIEIHKRTILPDSDTIEIKQCKKQKGLFQLDIGYTYRVKNEKVGKQYDLLSADPDILRNIVFDIVNNDKEDTSSIARIYGENGLVKDPRTGATMPYNKQFWKGNLEDFLDTWMSTITIYE
ncbi:MAG: AAA family ATPase, partial [Spirochaetales bacterium]|nr:AAA family ATPase [Spirochaetales bacterium]